MAIGTRFVTALKPVFVDEERRVFAVYFAVLVAGTAVHLVDDLVFGSDPKAVVAIHPWLGLLDRCLFGLSPTLGFLAIAAWLFCLAKMIRAGLSGQSEAWPQTLIMTSVCSPFGAGRLWLKRFPEAAAWSQSLHGALMIPLGLVLLWGAVVGIKYMRAENRREIEAYKARRAPRLNPSEAVAADVRTVGTASGERP